MNRVRLVPTAQRYINVLGMCDIDQNHKCLVTDDDRASYMFSRKGHEDSKLPEYITLDKVDYNLTPPPELKEVYAGSVYEDKGIPLSFLNVSSVEEGEIWYREHTKFPDCMVAILSRYQWGDLRRPVNKKAAKNAKKQEKRKKAKEKKKDKYSISYEPCVVKFD